MRIVVIVVRIQAGGRDEDEASTGAGGVSRAVRIVKIQAGGRDEDEALTALDRRGRDDERRRATTGAGGVSRAVRRGVRIPVRVEAGSNAVALRAASSSTPIFSPSGPGGQSGQEGIRRVTSHPGEGIRRGSHSGEGIRRGTSHSGEGIRRGAIAPARVSVVVASSSVARPLSSSLSSPHTPRPARVPVVGLLLPASILSRLLLPGFYPHPHGTSARVLVVVACCPASTHLCPHPCLYPHPPRPSARVPVVVASCSPASILTSILTAYPHSRGPQHECRLSWRRLLLPGLYPYPRGPQHECRCGGVVFLFPGLHPLLCPHRCPHPGARRRGRRVVVASSSRRRRRVVVAASSSLRRRRHRPPLLSSPVSSPPRFSPAAPVVASSSSPRRCRHVAAVMHLRCTCVLRLASSWLRPPSSSRRRCVVVAASSSSSFKALRRTEIVNPLRAAKLSTRLSTLHPRRVVAAWLLVAAVMHL